jgi:hypothetical protein
MQGLPLVGTELSTAIDSRGGTTTFFFAKERPNECWHALRSQYISHVHVNLMYCVSSSTVTRVSSKDDAERMRHGKGRRIFNSNVHL